VLAGYVLLVMMRPKLRLKQSQAIAI